MGTPFPNPVVGGGGQLVIPLIRSPDYMPGVSGWEIRSDGSAEFNDLDLRGKFLGASFLINSSGIFVYDASIGPDVT
jgi:hypothetical protein